MSSLHHTQVVLPRPFNELHTERAYLLATFEQQQRSSAEFINKIPLLEEKLLQDFPAAIRRRVRKQLNWFRHRLEEVTQQETAILARLGQITDEIASRERTLQLEVQHFDPWINNSNTPRGYVQQQAVPVYWNGYQQPQDFQQSFPSPLSPELYPETNAYPNPLHIPDPTSPGNFPTHYAPSSSNKTQLSPLSPNFIPSGIFIPATSFLTVPWQQSPGQLGPPSHWTQQQQRCLSIGSSLQRPGSSRDISPTRRLSQDRTDSDSAPISISVSIDTYLDPAEALDTVASDISPTTVSPTADARRASYVPEKTRPGSVDFAVCERVEGGEGNGAGSPVWKRHSVGNRNMRARRRSLPVLFGVSAIWAMTKEEEVGGGIVEAAVEEEEEEDKVAKQKNGVESKSEWEGKE